MQRGAGGSQCLRSDDCSVTLINREEQGALRQAAVWPCSSRWHQARQDVPLPPPVSLLRQCSGTPRSTRCPCCPLWALSRQREDQRRLLGPHRAARLEGCWWHLPPPVTWCMWLHGAGAGLGGHCLTPHLGSTSTSSAGAATGQHLPSCRLVWRLPIPRHESPEGFQGLGEPSRNPRAQQRPRSPAACREPSSTPGARQHAGSPAVPAGSAARSSPRAAVHPCGMAVAGEALAACKAGRV